MSNNTIIPFVTVSALENIAANLRTRVACAFGWCFGFQPHDRYVGILHQAYDFSTSGFIYNRRCDWDQATANRPLRS